jgi:hypothetical protein
VSAPAQTLRRKGEVRRLKGCAFDLNVNINGDRDRNGVRIGTGRLTCPDRVPVTIERDGVAHTVGFGRAFIDSKGNPRVRGLWAATPMGEYVRSLVDQEVLRTGNLELEASIDDDGARIYNVLGASFTLAPVLANPTLSPAAPGADRAAELLHLAALVYAAKPSERAQLVDQLISCAVSLGATPEATPADWLSTHVSG